MRRIGRFLVKMVLLPHDDEDADPCLHPDCIECHDCTHDCPCYIEPDFEQIMADRDEKAAFLDEVMYEKWINNL